MKPSQNQLIYKIETRETWEQAIKAGIYRGAPIDLNDGFIHFSTASQARQTAAKHFGDRSGLVIAALNADDLGEKLVWEISRNDELFPHLYDVLDMQLIKQTYDLPLGPDGQHVFHSDIAQ